MKLFKITLYLFLAAALFNACNKEYSLEGGGLKVPSGTWEFKDSLSQFQGNMDTAYITSATGSSTKELHLIGTSSDGSQTFHMELFADTLKTGTYKASLFQSSFEYAIPAKTIYQADQLVGEFIVNITSFGNNFVGGTFSGSALDSAGKIKNLSEGKFSSTIGSGAAAASVGVLGDSSGTCKPVILSGAYTQGVTLTFSNTVQVQVTVAVAGSYSISTNTVGGVTFSSAGTFTSAGVQTLILNGSGVPANSGNQNFTVSYGNSQCAFTINFAASGDYFPVTVNSNWTYGLEGGTSSDSIHTAVIGYSPSFGGKSYTTIASYNVPPSTAFDSLYYRKPGGDYYQYMDYSNLIPFDGPVAGEFIFLKDNVAAGTTWASPTISGTISTIPASGFIQMTLLEKAVPVTIGTTNFPDVIKVKYDYFVTGDPVPIETDVRWFAKDIGEIYDSISDGTSTDIYDIGPYQVF